MTRTPNSVSKDRLESELLGCLSQDADYVHVKNWASADSYVKLHREALLKALDDLADVVAAHQTELLQRLLKELPKVEKGALKKGELVKYSDGGDGERLIDVEDAQRLGLAFRNQAVKEIRTTITKLIEDLSGGCL